MELNKIYCESNLETMGKMPDNFVDLIITSPPYNKSGYEGFIRKRHEKDSWNSRNIDYNNDSKNDFIVESTYQAQQIKVLNEMQRVLKPNGSIFYNHKVRVAQHKASHPIEWILKTKLTLRQQIVWNRKNSPAVNPIRYLPTTELIFWLTKSPIQPNFCRHKESLFKGEVWDLSPKQTNLHPASFPEEIPFNIMMCIKDTKKILVYDPYSGIGTTCKVAKDFGFDFIGSETVKEYITTSKQIINPSTLQTKLF